VLQVLPFDTLAAREAGKLRQQLRERGTPIGDMDMLIAAHALSVNAVVVTNNVKEFARVPHLRTENWLE
jgi:tRNA(fMet)-specific endonuclease VapC